MGRPIKKSYFANLRYPYQDQATGGLTGQSGETIASIVNNNTATLYSTGTFALSITAPQLSGGTQAAATVSMANGTVDVITITNAGAGYTAVPTVTLTSTSTTGTTATFVATLANVVSNAIAISAWIPGGSSAKVGDIMKQESSRRYLVNTTDGVGQCKLVTDTPAEGQMTITATDSDGNTYYVKKLTAHRAVLIQDTGSGFQFADDSAAGWNLTAAEENVSVKLSSN